MNPENCARLEAFAHCCTEDELRSFLQAMTENGARERLRSHGHLALALAMEFNKHSLPVVRALLDQPEIQLNMPCSIGDDGNTVLHVAVLLQENEIVRMLLARADLNPNVVNVRGETPLHLAAVCSPDIILKLLLEDSRVNIAALTREHQTALHVACKSGIACSASNLLAAAETKVRSLPQFLGTADVGGRTALHYAAERGVEEPVREILRRSSNNVVDLIVAHDNTGCMAVHLAAQNGHEKVVAQLLEAHGSPTPEDRDGLTVLHHAVRGGHDSLVNEYLISPHLLSLQQHLQLLSLTTQFAITEHLLENLYETHVKAQHDVSIEKQSLKENVPGYDNWGVEIDDADIFVGDFAPNVTHVLKWAVVEMGESDDQVALITHILTWYPEKANQCLNDTTKRTALHIATILQKTRAVRAICAFSGEVLNANQRDADQKAALDYAYETEDKTIRRVLMARNDVQEHIARLNKQRDEYVKALNAVLVVAVLVAGATYARCFSAAESEDEAPRLSVRSWFNLTLPIKVAFFLSMTACILAAFAVLPFSFRYFFAHHVVDEHHVLSSLHRTRVLMVLVSYCLMLSFGGVLISFLCSQYLMPSTRIARLQLCAIGMVLFALGSVVFVAWNAVTSLRWKNLRAPRKPYLRLPALKQSRMHIAPPATRRSRRFSLFR